MKRASLVGISAVALLILACSDNDPPTGPATGSITVTVSTTGSDAPPGYTVVVGGSTTRSVDANGSVTISSVSSGAHPVELTDVPANCTVSTANPAMVTVNAGGTAPVAMRVACSAFPPLEVTDAALPDGVVSSGYSASLQATGGDGSYEWSISSGSLPGGLSLGNGLISGRPSEAGYFVFRIIVQSAGRADTIEARIRTYETEALRGFLAPLPDQIEYFIRKNEELLPRNPHLETEIRGKLELLADPDLEARILNERMYGEALTNTLDGRGIPVLITFPADTMRPGALEDLSRLPDAVAALETFVGMPWPYDFVHEWYGFKTGHSGAWGLIYMEDRGTYAERGVPHNTIIPHELAHTYIAHEGLTQFLEVYAYNLVETGSVNVEDWIWLRGEYASFAPENTAVYALLDIYQLIGPQSMGRAFKAIIELGAPYGAPLSAAAQQAFIDEAPASVAAQVSEAAARI